MTTPFHLFLLKKESVKRRLLIYYFTHPRSRHYLRELGVLLNADPANLSRDLASLEQEGIFHSETRGHQKYFSLNTNYSLYETLKTIVLQAASQGRKPKGDFSHSAYVIAGPNGAGKTTFAKTFLPELGCKTFINADLIAGGLAPLAPDRVALRAGKFLLEEIRNTARKKIDFGFETTLSGKSYVRLFRELIAFGYGIHLFFLWLPNVEMSLKRIEERVRRGGHHIPDDVVRRRFQRGVANLFGIYQPLLQSWTLFDNAGSEPVLVAHQEDNNLIIVDEIKYSKIKKLGGAL